MFPAFGRPARFRAGIAQLEEHLICNQGVAGSIPAAGTITPRISVNIGIFRNGRIALQMVILTGLRVICVKMRQGLSAAGSAF